jgi:hypothetical protein
MGPLSSTSTTGSLLPVASGAYLRSSISSRLMKSVLRLVELVTTVNSPLTASRTPSMARLRDWPGAWTRRSAPRGAHTYAK